MSTYLVTCPDGSERTLVRNSMLDAIESARLMTWVRPSGMSASKPPMASETIEVTHEYMEVRFISDGAVYTAMNLRRAA